MSISSNFFSTNNNSTALTAIDASSIINFPKEILELICRHLNSAKDVVRLASTHRKFYFLASNSLLSAPLWNLFLRKDFPDSCKDLKSETESLAFYKHLTNVVHNMKIGKCHLQTLNSDRAISCITILDGKLISSSGDTIKIWDLNMGQEIQTLDGHERSISYIAILDGKIISGSYDNTIKIWDLNTGQEIQTLNGHQDGVRCMTILEGKIISGSDDNTIKIWDLNTGQEIQTLNGHQSWVSCMTILEGKIISGSVDHTIKIWDLNTGQEIQTLKGHQGGVKCMTILDGKLISGSWDSTIKIWDLNTGQEIQTLKGHTDKITCMTILDGKIISGSDDNTIKIWDLNTGQEIQTLKGHEGGITCMTILDGKLISGSDDNTIKIWDLNTGQEIQTLKSYEGGWIACITILDGKIISGSGDNTIKIWDFNLPSLSSHFQKEQAVIKPKQILKDHWGENLPLLIDLGIVTKEEYSEKLNCRPDDLPKRGICSPADLQALFNSPDFQYLQITAEEIINNKDYAQPQVRAHRKKEIVFTLLDQLLAAAKQKSDEAKQCSVIRDDNGNVYDAPNPWIAFQEKLNGIQDALNIQTQASKELLNKFSPESYAELVKEANALIDEFRTLERGTQILRLRAYVNQWGIFGIWKRLNDQGITSLSALLQQKNIAPQDIFNMGE